MNLAFTLARRELRRGVRGLWIVLLCLALGVGVIAAVGTLRAAVDAGLSADGRSLLGGDLEANTQLGVATSGYYVREAKSPTLSELNGFVQILSQKPL